MDKYTDGQKAKMFSCQKSKEGANNVQTAFKNKVPLSKDVFRIHKTDTNDKMKEVKVST